MANLGYDFALIPAGTVATASGAGTGIEVDNKDEFRGQVVVSAVSGTTPSLTVTVQTSYDNGVTDSWRNVGSAFGAVTTATSSAHQTFNGLDRWVRASYVISGTTPSFTFGVLGEAV